jgi:hypothetical protein
MDPRKGNQALMKRKYAFTSEVRTVTDINSEMSYKQAIIWCDLCNGTFTDKTKQPIRVPDEILERSFMIQFANEHDCEEIN